MILKTFARLLFGTFPGKDHKFASRFGPYENKFSTVDSQNLVTKSSIVHICRWMMPGPTHYMPQTGMAAIRLVKRNPKYPLVTASSL